MSGFNRFPQIEKALMVAMASTIEEACNNIASTARQSVDTIYPPASAPGQPPAGRTGELLENIQVRIIDPTKGEVFDNSDHAIFTEFGTVHMAARPWLTPAAEAEVTQLLESGHKLEDKIRDFGRL